jgi:hypothetical protein
MFIIDGYTPTCDTGHTSPTVSGRCLSYFQQNTEPSFHRRARIFRSLICTALIRGSTNVYRQNAGRKVRNTDHTYRNDWKIVRRSVTPSMIGVLWCGVGACIWQV